MKPTITWIFSAVLLLGACGEAEATPATSDDEATSPEAPPDEAPTPAAEQPAEAVPALREAGQAPQTAALPGSPGEQAVQAVDAQRLGEILAEAAEHQEGDTPCEQAFNGAQAMFAAFQKQGQVPNGRFPTREQFIEVCVSLPESAQNCFVMSYAVSHQAECQVALNSPEVRRLQEAMRGRRPAPAAPAAP